MIPFAKIPKPRCEALCAGPMYDCTKISFDARKKEGFRCRRTARYILPDGHKVCTGHAVTIDKMSRPVEFYNSKCFVKMCYDD